MMRVYQVHRRGDHGVADDTVVLDHLQREKGRLRAITAAGDELRIFLERGRALAVGEVLTADCGRRFGVAAAVEPVLRAETDDWLLFARACYHLGNRHVKLQVGERWLRIVPDHVLAEMLEQLGLQTCGEAAPFVPEQGAYAGHGHQHFHHDDHDHGEHRAHDH